jgi:MFS family permease
MPGPLRSGNAGFRSSAQRLGWAGSPSTTPPSPRSRPRCSTGVLCVEAHRWVGPTAAYTLVFGGLMVFGGCRTLLVRLALLTAASLVCGLAVSGGMLIAGRALQGNGAPLDVAPDDAIVATLSEPSASGDGARRDLWR